MLSRAERLLKTVLEKEEINLFPFQTFGSVVLMRGSTGHPAAAHSGPSDGTCISVFMCFL